MSTSTMLVERYIEIWNESDAERRRALVAETFTEDAHYLDPLMSGTGLDEIDAMIAAAQREFPGHRFSLASGPDAHHDRLRFGWALAPDGGDVLARGTDFVTLAPDGRMRSVTGFVEAAGVGTAGYAVAHVQSVNPGPEIAEYLARIDATLAPFDGRFLVHGDPADVREGDFSGDLIVIGFPDRERVVGWYESAAYREIVALRTTNTTGWVVLVDGVPVDHRATDILSPRATA